MPPSAGSLRWKPPTSRWPPDAPPTASSQPVTVVPRGAREIRVHSPAPGRRRSPGPHYRHPRDHAPSRRSAPRPDTPATPADLSTTSLPGGRPGRRPWRSRPPRRRPPRRRPRRSKPPRTRPTHFPVATVPPARPRRALRTAAWGFAGLLIAVLLGWAAAVMMGLTGRPTDLASGAAGAFPVQRGRSADRTLRAHRRGHAGETAPLRRGPHVGAGNVTAETAPASAPRRARRGRVPAPSVVPDAAPGPHCRRGGPLLDRGGFRRDGGRPEACTVRAHSNSKSRWRHAP